MGRVLRGCLGWIRRHPFFFLLTIVVGLSAVGGVTALQRQRTIDARRHWESAEQAESACDFAAVRRELTDYLAVHPGDAQAHFRLARACRRDPRESFSVAEEHLKTAYASGYTPADIHLENALLAFQSSGESGAQENALKSYLDRRPESEPLILEALARGCLRSGRLNDANVWLNRWVKNHPGDWYARLWRGSLHQHLNQAPLAIEDYRQVLKVWPERRDVRRRLGLVLATSGYDYQEAQAYLKEAVQEQSDDVDAQVALARCLHAARQPEQAQAMLKQVLVGHPDHVQAMIYLVMTQVDLRQDQDALKVLKQLDPLVEQFDNQGAMERLWQLDPVPFQPQATQRMETFLYLQGTVLRRLGREGEARAAQAKLQRLQDNTAALTRAVLRQQERPRDADLLCRIGDLQMQLGRDKEGVRWLEKAIQVEPRHQRAHQLLSEYYATLDDPEAKRRADEHRRLAQGSK